ncbi:FMO-2 protein [Aphelenchoides avenae]|nr:FMO-2 protein [Aphelenchus avenae]
MSKRLMAICTEMGWGWTEGRACDTPGVDCATYVDDLASRIGCRQSIARYAVTGPTLTWALLFGTNAFYAYRLCGPHNGREHAKPYSERSKEFGGV